MHIFPLALYRSLRLIYSHPIKQNDGFMVSVSLWWFSEWRTLCNVQVCYQQGWILHMSAQAMTVTSMWGWSTDQKEWMTSCQRWTCHRTKFQVYQRKMERGEHTCMQHYQKESSKYLAMLSWYYIEGIWTTNINWVEQALGIVFFWPVTYHELDSVFPLNHILPVLQHDYIWK